MQLKSVLKGERFTNTEEDTARVVRALADIGKMVTKNAFKSFTDIGKCVLLPKVTAFKEMLCK
jgi:hypothetical protein